MESYKAVIRPAKHNTSMSTPELKDACIQWLKNHPLEPYRVAAELFRCPVSTISYISRAAGLIRQRGHHPPGAKKRWPERDYAGMLKKYPNKSYGELATMLRVSHWTIASKAQELGLRRPKGRPMAHPFDAAELRSYILSHPDTSLDNIAAHFQISRATVSRFCKTEGITRYRPRTKTTTTNKAPSVRADRG